MRIEFKSAGEKIIEDDARSLVEAMRKAEPTRKGRIEVHVQLDPRFATEFGMHRQLFATVDVP